MLPNYYEFFSPVKILSGYKALDHLPYELGLLNVRRPLIITDKGVVGAGLLTHVKQAFDGSGMTIGSIFDDIPVDSSTEVVHRVARVFRENNCDAIVAVGGGSPMDTAKAVNIVLSEGVDDLKKFEGADRLKSPMKPLVAIPTTAGTGSEVTFAAVIKDTERKVKMSFASHLLFPRLAILDPRMTLTMPPRITAATGMDALTHAMEAFTCLQKNPISDAHAVSAIHLIREYFIEAVKDGRNTEARLGMANAATLAGIAFSNAMVGMVHSLGHATGAICNVPHGVAMSIFLPLGLAYNMDKTRPCLEQLLLFLGGEEQYVAVAPEKRAEKTIALVNDLKETLFELCGFPRTLKEAGVDKDALEQIASTALNDGTIVFNPMELNFEDALAVLNRAYD